MTILGKFFLSTVSQISCKPISFVFVLIPQFLIQSIVSTIYWIGQFTISFCVIQSLYFPRKSITLALKFMQQQRKGGNAVYNCDVISKELARNKNHAVQ
jgi:hypothetical protein